MVNAKKMEEESRAEGVELGYDLCPSEMVLRFHTGEHVMLVLAL